MVSCEYAYCERSHTDKFMIICNITTPMYVIYRPNLFILKNMHGKLKRVYNQLHNQSLTDHHLFIRIGILDIIFLDFN